MMTNREPHNSQWVIVTFNRPFFWQRSEDETWVFNPERRYVMNANQLGNIQGYIENISDLKTSRLFKPLLAGQGCNLHGAKVLVERFRERGLGDLLFLTGPMQYLQFLAGNEAKIDMYALADRGPLMQFNPVLRYGATMVGAVHYDDLAHYDYHWFVDTATEYDEEVDQLNVYDSLYKTLGLNPENVPAQYKRPYITIDPSEGPLLDQFFYLTFLEKKLDLRKTGYYVVAPLARGSLRSAHYAMWLNVINELKTRRPVIVVGSLEGKLPDTDMSVGEFHQHIAQAGPNVVNALKSPAMPVRMLINLISKATAVACLDSGPLYIAQALRVPAVSVWGPHDPVVRIGYDQQYMNLAVWNQAACRRSPCYAYACIPANKCPNGQQQHVCEVLRSVDAGEILKKFDLVEQQNAIVKPAQPLA